MTSESKLVICLEVYQNQRWWPLSKWKPGKLLPTDRREFTNKDGKETRSLQGTAANAMLGEGFIWVPGSAWSLEISSSITDGDGWQYAIDFPATYQKKMTIGCMVRRRRWWREAVFVGKEESVGKLVDEPLPPGAVPTPTNEDDRPVCEDGRKTPPEDRPENYPVSSGIFEPTDSTLSETVSHPMVAVNACSVAAEKGERFSLPQSFVNGGGGGDADTTTRQALSSSSLGASGSRQHSSSSGAFVVPPHAIVSAEEAALSSSSSRRFLAPNPIQSVLVDDGVNDRQGSLQAPDFTTTSIGREGEEVDSSWGGRVLPPQSSTESPEFDDLMKHFVSQAAIPSPAAADS